MSGAARATARSLVRRVSARVGATLDGASPRFRDYVTRGLTTFIFHDITDDPSGFQRETGSYTTLAEFRAQVEWILARFTVISPEDLPQLSASTTERPLPHNAALITFDDAWAGIPRAGLPILHEYGCPGVWFVNMGTILGDPDVAVAGLYERRAGARPESPSPPYSRASGGERLAEIRDRYSDDEAFLEYQGRIASVTDLQEAAETPGVGLGSHLYHHWDLNEIDDSLYRDSIQANRDAMADLANQLPILSTPFGFAGEWALRSPRDFGYRLIFVGTCRQEWRVSQDDVVLDRLFLPSGQAAIPSWWYAVHRKRIFGRYAT